MIETVVALLMFVNGEIKEARYQPEGCLLYTSDAADE